VGKALSALKSQEEALIKAKKVVEKAKTVCSRNGWGLVGAYLVGSRARGDYVTESDIDIVLVVRGIEKLNTLERLTMFKEVLEPGVELFVYTPEEWLSSESLWIIELRREAVVLS